MRNLSLEKIYEGLYSKRYYIRSEYQIDDAQGLEDDICKKNYNHADDPEFQKCPISERELIAMFFLFGLELGDLLFQIFKFIQLFLIVRLDRLEKIRSALDDFVYECHPSELRNKY